MKRRAILILALTLGLLIAPVAAEAQPAGTSPRLGMLLTGSASDMTQARELDALKKKLSELGWIEGRNLGVEARWAEDPESLPSLAADLVRLGVDIILTPGPSATLAARTATSTIPIVTIAGTESQQVGATSLGPPER